MPVQTFWDAGSAIEFPQFMVGGGAREAGTLTGLYFIAAADSLVGRFHIRPEVPGINLGIDFGTYQLQKIWRGGQIVQIGGDVPVKGFTFWTPFWAGGVVPTTDGRLLRSPQVSGAGKEKLGFVIEDPASIGASGPTVDVAYENFYAADPLWPGNILIPGKIVDAAVMLPTGLGLVDPTLKVGYVAETSAGQFAIVSHLASDVILTSSVVFGPIDTSTDLSYKPVWQMLYIDASTIACVFGVNGGPFLGPIVSSPGIIRVFDTVVDTTKWTLLWEDELPAATINATYDTVNQVLYSIGIHASTAILHASKLKRQPTVFASASIKGTTQTELVPLVKTVLSTIVTHGSGGFGAGHASFTSFLSNELLLWTLDSDVASLGSLASSYSLTDDNGSSTIEYFGPAAPDAGLTERVNITVAEIANV